MLLPPENNITMKSLADVKPAGGRLGKGSFASVRLVKHKNYDKLLALKVVDLTSSLNYEVESNQIMRELKIHKELKHPNIVRVYDYIEEDRKFYLLMDYAAKGDLFKFLTKRKRLKEKEVKHVMYQLTRSIDYIHRRGIIHRDLKLENILLDEGDRIKLCDFGWCTDQKDMRTTFCGTYEYMAPELVERALYDYKIDIWGLGILCYELLHGRSPFKAYNAKAIMEKIRKCKYDIHPKVSKESREFIRSCLQRDPQKRPKAKGLLMSSFFDEIRSHYSKKNNPKKHMSVNPVRSQMRTLGGDHMIINDQGNTVPHESFRQGKPQSYEADIDDYECRKREKSVLELDTYEPEPDFPMTNDHDLTLQNLDEMFEFDFDEIFTKIKEGSKSFGHFFKTQFQNLIQLFKSDSPERPPRPMQRSPRARRSIDLPHPPPEYTQPSQTNQIKDIHRNLENDWKMIDKHQNMEETDEGATHRNSNYFRKDNKAKADYNPFSYPSKRSRTEINVTTHEHPKEEPRLHKSTSLKARPGPTHLDPNNPQQPINDGESQTSFMDDVLDFFGLGEKDKIPQSSRTVNGQQRNRGQRNQMRKGKTTEELGNSISTESSLGFYGGEVRKKKGSLTKIEEIDSSQPQMKKSGTVNFMERDENKPPSSLRERGKNDDVWAQYQ